MIAGADLEAGGTWMGVHPEHGRIAMVTNVRDPRDLTPRRAGEPSRGALVRDFLVGELSAERFVAQARHAGMRGFNLIAIDRGGAHWCSNRGGEPTRLHGGIHGVSNALLDTPWPKVVRAKQALEHAMRGAERDDEAQDEARRETTGTHDSHSFDAAGTRLRERFGEPRGDCKSRRHRRITPAIRLAASKVAWSAMAVNAGSPPRSGSPR